MSLGRRWYLVAYDLARHDWRTFRLDRLERPNGTGDRFAPRRLPAADAAAFVRAGIDHLPAPTAVEVLGQAPPWPFAIASAGGSRLRTSTASVAGCE